MARLLLPLASMLLLAAACSQRTTATASAPSDAARPPAAPLSDATARTAIVITVVDGLPAKLAAETPLWESAHFSTGPFASATRLYRDGGLYGYRTVRRTVVDGKQVIVATPPSWRLSARVSRAGLAQVERAIRNRIETGFLHAGASASDADLGPQQIAVTYRASVDGRDYAQVQVKGDGPSPDLPTPMTGIEAAIHMGIVPGSVPAQEP